MKVNTCLVSVKHVNIKVSPTFTIIRFCYREYVSLLLWMLFTKPMNRLSTQARTRHQHPGTIYCLHTETCSAFVMCFSTAAYEMETVDWCQLFILYDKNMCSAIQEYIFHGSQKSFHFLSAWLCEVIFFTYVFKA